jgi:ribosome maturation factor RimP
MNWQAAVEKTVTGLGYEMVDCERSAAGLLRVYIDKLPEAAAAGETISVDDCERVTRQLQYVLEVEAAPYERLEVSSPGLDRPLRKAADYARFAGSEVQLTLKLAFQGRKKYKGLLSAEGEGWRLVFADDKGVEQALDFSLEEVKDARLVPAFSFKGRNAAGATPAAKGAKKKPAKRSNAKARQVADEQPAAMDDKG